MKKTLFLSLALGLASASTYADDVFVPQSIIDVQKGADVSLSTELTDDALHYDTSTANESATVADVMAQKQQFTKNYSKRSAIVKDGQGTLTVDGNVAMQAPLLVREGTLVIKDATVTNRAGDGGNNLSVSGVNAHLVLDNGHYTTLDKNEKGQEQMWTSSVSVGAIDGDGTLTLKNGSTLHTVQTIFTGGSSNLPMPDAADPAWNVNPHSGGSYAYVDTDPASSAVIGAGNTYYRHATEDAGFSNPFLTPAGSRLSTATVNVLSGSTLESGTGFYLYNTTLNIDGEGSTVRTGVRNKTDNVYIGSSFGLTAEVNITGGGRMDIQNEQYVCLSYYDGQQSKLNISGAGSALTCSYMAYVGKDTGKSDVSITDGGRMAFAAHYIMRGQAGSHHMLIDGADSYFQVGSTWQIGGAEVVISNGAGAQAQYWDSVADSKLTLTGGAMMFAFQGGMYDGSLTVVEKDSYLSVYKAYLNSGATLINHGYLWNYADNKGEYNSDTYLYAGSRLQTGEALISGCEGLAAEGHEAQVDYTTGLGEYMTLHYAADSGDAEDAGDSGTLTLGALLTGKDEMQYLSAADMQLINNRVLAELGLAKTEEGNYSADEKGRYLAANDAYTVSFKHEIGENISVNYTTDHLNKHNGAETIAVNGGAILVEQGTDDSHDDTKVGTLGSYADSTTETAARVAVGETKSGSIVRWEGSKMETIHGEETTLIAGTDIAIGTSEAQGELHVVSDSTLNNNGVIDARTTVDGTLKGSGIMSATTITSSGALIVGNSPGLQTFTGDLRLEAGSVTTFSVASLQTAATAENHGWDSGTYSQITLSNSACLYADEAACFVIAFGGEELMQLTVGETGLSFALTLVYGGVAAENIDTEALLAHTTFTITDEEGGRPELPFIINVCDAVYAVEGSNLVLHGQLSVTPEPATATLSLLALAALAARRRRTRD